MKHIVVFGAGKSSTSLIDYLIALLLPNNWKLTVLDVNRNVALAKTKGAANTSAETLDVENVEARKRYVQSADIAISLLPPALHDVIAIDCLEFGRDLLTASYISPQIKKLGRDIESRGLLFLCEMGLDPGIDHMSAMRIIHDLKARHAHVTSFRSHCGGLVAPESDDNPWHYKISWNPRNVVMAGKAGADFRQRGKTVHKEYQELFEPSQLVQVSGLGALSFYPNRDSLPYIPVYGLQDTDEFVRTTLRYPAFSDGWRKIITLHLTREDLFYDTNQKTLAAFFSEHFAMHNNPYTADATFMEQLRFFGLDDKQTTIDKGNCSAAHVLQFILETKLVLRESDRDMVVMLHEIDYLTEGRKRRSKSELIVKGADNLHTAMAKTVGLPLGIATKLILQKIITRKGLHIPIMPDIYLPVLKELEEFGIQFSESDTIVD